MAKVPHKSRSAGMNPSAEVKGPPPLFPPFDFIHYFHNKLQKLSRDSTTTEALLLSYKESGLREGVLQKKLRERDEEAFRLQEALNEAQLALYEEREKRLRLQSEHEKLLVEKNDFRRKYQTALFLSGRTEEDVNRFLSRRPKAKELTDQMIKVKAQIRSCSGEKVDQFESLDSGMLRKEVCRLEEELNKTHETHHNKLESLKDAFSLSRKETSLRIEQLKNRLALTVDQLKEKTDILEQSLSENVYLQKRLLEAEDEWMVERKRLMSHVQAKSQTKPTHLHAFLDCATEAKGEDSSDIVKRLERNTARLEGEVMGKETLILELQKTALVVEKQKLRLKEERDEYKRTLEVERKKLNSRNEVLAKRLESTEVRLKLDGAGYRADVAEIKKLLRFFETSLEKVFNQRNRGHESQKLISRKGPGALRLRPTDAPPPKELGQPSSTASDRNSRLSVVVPLPRATRLPLRPRLVLTERALRKLMELTKDKVKILDALIKKRMETDRG